MTEPVVSDLPVVVTGPIKGTVTLADGTVIDVTPHAIAVETAEQAQEVADLIGDRYAAEGHPAHMYGDPFHVDEAQRADRANTKKKG